MATEKRLIDANALTELLDKEYRRKMELVRKGNPHLDTLAEGIMSTSILLGTIPIVDAVEVVHGRWKATCLAGGFSEEWGYICSECGCTVSERSGLGVKYTRIHQGLNFCPNCGAKMDGDGNA